MSDNNIKNNHALEIIPPHAIRNQLRFCLQGTFTIEEAQALVELKFRGPCQVLEVRPVQWPSDSTEIIFTQTLPKQQRIYYKGTLSMEEAQMKLGSTCRVLEVYPATCYGPDPISDPLVAATEVIFART